MEENRSIKELLKLMLKFQDLFASGLCHWVTNMYIYREINLEEKDLLKKYIKNNRVSIFSSFSAYHRRNSAFYWEPNNITYRIKWIKKHIKLNS